MSSGPVTQHHARATGSPSHMGTGEASVSKSTTGYAKGGHVKSKHTAGSHNMDGHIGQGGHHDSHKTHGHHVGVHHTVSGGVHAPGGAGGTKGAGKGPSSNQFGAGEPHGGSLGKW